MLDLILRGREKDGEGVELRLARTIREATRGFKSMGLRNGCIGGRRRSTRGPKTTSSPILRAVTGAVRRAIAIPSWALTATEGRSEKRGTSCSESTSRRWCLGER